MGDDAFGVAVAQRLAQHTLPPEVRVVDFGIRGLDLAYALLEPYTAVILVDAMPRGAAPGTLCVLELDVRDATISAAAAPVSGHNLDPATVLSVVAGLGGHVEQLLLVGCEPTPASDESEMKMGLSDAVRAAVGEAVPLIEALVAKLLRGEPVTGSAARP
jgi:hydrogenase maturation protease